VKARKDIRDSRRASVLDRGHAVDLLQRDRPEHRDAALPANVAAVSL